jgi:hypothetical protein
MNEWRALEHLKIRFGSITLAPEGDAITLTAK